MTSRTYTRVHVYEQFANPHLACDKCGKPVHGWHDDEKCDCCDGCWNEPCECRNGGVTSVCPSWSPVDGCTCVSAHVSPWPRAW